LFHSDRNKNKKVMKKITFSFFESNFRPSFFLPLHCKIHLKRKTHPDDATGIWVTCPRKPGLFHPSGALFLRVCSPATGHG